MTKTPRQAIAEIHAAAQWVRRGGRKCDSCKANVVFARNAGTGRWQILDWLPSWDRGNVLIEPDVPLSCTVVERGEHEERPLHLDHHVTCPYADQHRRGK